MSKPNGWPLRGDRALSAMLQLCGLPWPNQPAKAWGTMATRIMSTTTAALAQKSGWRARRWAAPTDEGSASAGLVSAVTAKGRTSRSVKADPRVDDPVEQVDDQVEEQEDEDQQGGHPDHDRALLLLDGGEEELADAGEVEDTLDDHRSPEQVPEVQGHVCHDADQRVADDVLEEHGPAGDALGPGRAHVVGLEALEHARAHQPGHRREPEGTEDEGGQQVADRPAPADAGDREDPRLDPEEELGDIRHHEGRDRHQEHRRGEGGVVAHPALAQGGHHPDAEAEDDLDQPAHDGQLEGHRPPGPHQAPDAVAVEVGAEIAVDQPGQVAPVLVEEGLVEVVMGLERVDGRLRELLVAGQAPDGLAGQDEHGQVQDQRHPDEDEDQLDEAADHVARHPVIPPPGAGRRSRRSPRWRRTGPRPATGWARCRPGLWPWPARTRPRTAPRAGAGRPGSSGCRGRRPPRPAGP